VLLFLHDDFAEHFAERKFSHLLGLPDALAVGEDRHALVFEIEAQHVLGLSESFTVFGGVTGVPLK